jgi:hypothetical protein
MCGSLAAGPRREKTRSRQDDDATARLWVFKCRANQLALEKRAFVTNDVEDFLPPHDRPLAASEHHPEPALRDPPHPEPSPFRWPNDHPNR